MATASTPLRASRIQCYWRPMILGVTACLLLGLFWFTSRYPQLFKKAEHLGRPVASMAFGSALITVAPDAPLWRKVPATMINWLDGMKIGMSFGVAF
ncbi:hypothetical protein ACYOEI_27915, partial [Singulisphaera rosea]